MTIELDHTIVHSHDRQAGAELLASLFGLEVDEPMEPFLPVQVGRATLDDATSSESTAMQHDAFLVSEDEIDEIWGRIEDRRIDSYPAPWASDAGQINHNERGRGRYPFDPSGHGMEIVTRADASGDA